MEVRIKATMIELHWTWNAFLCDSGFSYQQIFNIINSFIWQCLRGRSPNAIIASIRLNCFRFTWASVMHEELSQSELSPLLSLTYILRYFKDLSTLETMQCREHHWRRILFSTIFLDNIDLCGSKVITLVHFLTFICQS